MPSNTELPPAIRIGVFFSHPTQHHSIMFRYLSQLPGVSVAIYYYDPATGGKMHDADLGTAESWDLDLLSGTNSQILWNPLRGERVRVGRQVNPGLIRAMIRGRFDAVFVSGYASPSNWLVWVLAQVLGVPVLYQADTNILDERRHKGSRLKRRLRDIFLRRVRTFLVIGDKNQEVYVANGLDQNRMIWCPCPVDTDRFRAIRLAEDQTNICNQLRVQYSIPLDARVLVFCGKLIARKRPQDIIEASRLLQRANVYTVIIGSGIMERSLREAIQAEDKVVITGFVNQTMVPYHLLLGDIGVVCSEWDPHPLVVTEMAACGLPIIVSHFCGVWGDHDILRPHENGLVYPCGDISALAASIAMLLDDASLRLQMSLRSPILANAQSAKYAAQVIADHVRQLVIGNDSSRLAPRTIKMTAADDE